MLTDSQRKTLTFIRQYFSQHGYAPKLPEIAAGIGISSRGVVHRYVQALAEAGHLELIPGKHRGMRLLEADRQAGCIPLLGKIAAGRPIEAIVDEEEINLQHFFTGRDQFAVRVEGDSMVEMGIMEGDVVIVEASDSAQEGDVVVALIDENEATLKRLEYTDAGLIRLVPANRTMKPMVYEPEQVRIQGVLVGSLRRY